MSSDGLAPAQMEQSIYDKMVFGFFTGCGVGIPLTFIVLGIMLGVGFIDEGISCLACVPGCTIIGTVTPLIIGAVRKHIDEKQGETLEQNYDEL